MSKVHAINTVCKHRLANELFYVDIGPRLSSTETVVSATVTSGDEQLTIGTLAVLTSPTTVINHENESITIEADTGISVNLSGGTIGEQMLEVVFVKDTGSTDAVDCKLTIPGHSIYLKRGSKQDVLFPSVLAVSMSDVIMGIKDTAGRSMLKVTGTINSSTDLTFSITASESMKLIEGEHAYDVFELASYVASTGAYTDSNLILSGTAIVKPLYARLENT